MCANCGERISRVMLPGDKTTTLVHDKALEDGLFSAHMCRLSADPMADDYEGPMPHGYRGDWDTEYIVLRPAPGTPSSWLSVREGEWLTRPSRPFVLAMDPRSLYSSASANLVPRWERRADGVIAQVAEVRP